MMSFTRTWLTAGLTCGAVLIPAGSALANHMPGMTNGTMCPHASGEGPDALGAAPPSESSGGTQRTSSDAPLGAASDSAPSGSTAADSAAPASGASKPATQATEPATQVQTQRAAVTAAQPALATAGAQVTRLATTSVPARSTVATPSRRAAPRARTERRSAPRRQPHGRVLETSTPVAPATTAATLTEVTQPRTLPPLAAVLGILAIVGLAAATTLMRRRRPGSGGVATAPRPATPAAPSFADASLEAELHEMISEARARAVLARAPRADPAEHRETIASR